MCARAQTAIEALIHINNQLRQPEAAVGVLTYAQKNLSMELKEGWYEKLCRWDDALAAYERRLAREAPGTLEAQAALLGKMRCLGAKAEWEPLASLCRAQWKASEPHVRCVHTHMGGRAWSWWLVPLAWSGGVQYTDTQQPGSRMHMRSPTIMRCHAVPSAWHGGQGRACRCVW